MAAWKRGSLFLPTLQQCRTKFHTKNPKPRVLPRRVFEIITKPIIPETLETPPVGCSFLMKQKIKIKEEKENLYEQFLIRRCREMFEENTMIIVFSRLPIKLRDQYKVERTFKRQGLKLELWSNSIIKQTISGSKWQNLAPLIVSENCFVTSPENRVKDVVHLAKSTPQLVMLGGVVEDRLMSKEGLVKLANLPSMDLLLGQTVSILNSGASKTHTLLGRHQQELSQNLEQYIKDRQQKFETTKHIYGGDSSVRGDGGGRGCEVRADSTYTIPEHKACRGCEVRADSTYTIPEHKACKNCWHSKG